MTTDELFEKAKSMALMEADDPSRYVVERRTILNEAIQQLTIAGFGSVNGLAKCQEEVDALRMMYFSPEERMNLLLMMIDDRVALLGNI